MDKNYNKIAVDLLHRIYKLYPQVEISELQNCHLMKSDIVRLLKLFEQNLAEKNNTSRRPRSLLDTPENLQC